MPKRAYRPKPPSEIARNMSAIRSTENRTEVALRKALFALGLRYRLYRKDLAGTPDIVFPRQQVAVFVDGDYWHCRLLVESGRRALSRKLARLPVASRAYWMSKFTRRVKRDREVNDLLERAGWAVLRLWESDVKRDVASSADRVAKLVRTRSRLRR